MDDVAALKIFRKRNMNLFALNAAHFEHFIMKSLDHENILSCKGYFEDNDYIIIIYELMSSDLRSLLVELDAPLSEPQVKKIFHQMLLSIDHCHQRNIVHRDVKLENFLVDTNADGNIIIKLSDFGLACKFEKEKPPTTKCGSILSVAPEMLTLKSYCHKVDMWGLGIILHELLTTQLPFYNDDENLYKNNIVNERLKIGDADVWQDVSTEAKDLISKLLDKNPVTRLSSQ